MQSGFEKIVIEQRFYLGEQENSLATVRDEHVVGNTVVLQPNASTGQHICQIIQGIPSLKNQSSNRIIYQLGHIHSTIHVVRSKRNLLGSCLLDREWH
jgi:hypothetical protein